MFRRKFLMAAIVAGIATLAGPATSQAAFTVNIKVYDGVDNTGALLTNVTINDDVVGLSGDFNPITGQIIFVNSTVVGLTTTITASSGSQSNAPNPGIAAILADGVNVVNVGNLARFVVITMSDTFNTPPSGGSGLVRLQSFGDVTGAAFLNGASATVQGTVSGGVNVTTSDSPLVLDSSVPSIVVAGTPVDVNRTGGTFDLTHTISVSVGGNSSASFSSASTVAAPAPAGLILAATALPFVGLLRRRLRRPETTTAA